MKSGTSAEQANLKVRSSLRQHAWIILSILLFANFAQAQSSGITYHGRILKPDGTPLEGPTIQFKMQIRSGGNENCLMYEEIQSKDLRNAGGVFSITLNDGSGSRGADEYSPGLRLTLDKVFQNKGSFASLPNCDSGAGYTPNSADGRRFVVFFRETPTAVWEKMPSQMINFAPLAIEAKQVGGFTPQHLLRVDDSAALANTTPLTTTQFNDLMALINGTSTVYGRSNQLNGAAIPALSAGQSLQWNGTAWSAATSITSESDPTVQAFAKTGLPTCAAGEVLRSNGTGFVCVTDATGGTPADATTTSKGIVQISATGGISISAGVISLPDQGGITAGSTYPKVTVDAKGRVTAGAALAETDIPSITNAWSGSIDGSKITGTIGGSTAISTSGAITTGGAVSGRTINVFDTDTNKVSITTSPLAADYALTLPAALPSSSGYVLAVDTSGQLSWVAAASGSVTAVTAAAPLSSTGGTSPQISISQSSGTTNGYLSSTDWTTFNNKLSAVGGTTLNSGNIWVGNASNQAAAVAATGDVTLSNAGAFAVTKIRGRDVATTTPVTGQILRYNASNAWEAANFSVADLRKTDGTSQFASATCTAGQTLNWSSLTDTFTCVSISVASSQVTGLGTAAAKNFGTAAGNLVELDAGAKIPASLIPAGAASQWTTTGSDIYYNTGKVGIGTTAPNRTLQVGTGAGIVQVGGANGLLLSTDPNGVVKMGSNAYFDQTSTTRTGATNTGGFGYAFTDMGWGSIQFFTGGGNTTADAAISPTARMIIESDGDVGVGTTSPTSKLTVRGPNSGATSSILRMGAADIGDSIAIGNGTATASRFAPVIATESNNSAYVGLSLVARGPDAGGSSTVPYMHFAAGTPTGDLIGGSLGTVANRPLFQFSNNTTPMVTIGATGNLGVGTTSPTNDISLGGDSARVIGVERHSTTTGGHLTIVSGGARAGTTDLNGGDLFLSTGPSTGNGSAGIYFRTTASGSSGTTSNFATNKMFLDGSGRLGIGTLNPGAMLDVKGEMRLSGATSGYTGFRPAAAAGSTVWQLPSTDGTSGQALVTNGSGVLTWQTPSGTGVSTLTVNAPITNGGTATAPNLSIAQANGSTNGYLSSADWTTFNNKLGTSLTSANIWVGNGSNVATGVAPSGDVSMTNAGAFTVTKIQTRSVASTLPVTSQVLRYNTATTSWEPQYVNFGDLKKSDGTSQFPGTPCTAAQTLTWSSLTDTFVCSNISIASTQVTGLGTAAAKNFGTAAGNLVELDAGAKIPASLLPAGAASQWTTTGSDIYYTAGNVGVGVTSPTQELDVNGDVQVTGGFKVGTAGSFAKSVVSDTDLILRIDANNNSATDYFAIQKDASTDLLRILENGNVGIGTAAPDRSLHVSKSTAGDYVGTSGSVASPVDLAASKHPALTLENTLADTGAGSYIDFTVTNGQSQSQKAYVGAYSVDGPGTRTPIIVIGSQTGANSYTERLRINEYGNVGIATTTPNSSLSFGGDSARTIAMERSPNATANPLTISAGGVNAGSTNANGGSLILTSGIATGSGGSNIELRTATPGSSGTADITPSTKMTILGNGNVGIGTASPSNRLQVVDDGNAAANGVISVKNGTTGASARAAFSAEADNSGVATVVGQTSTTYNNGFQPFLGASSGYLSTGGSGGLRIASTNNSNGADISFWGHDGTAITERMRIKKDGFVGIGTSSPGAMLDVKGAIRMSGATSGYTGFQPAAAAGSTVWTLPTADGSSGQVLTTNGSGVLAWSTPSGTGVTSVTATAPLSSSGGATPQISITQANGSTNGYLSSTDWTTFNNKLGTSLTNGSIWVGNGSGVATAVAPAGDVTMTNAGSFSVTKLRGYTVQNQAPGDGQVFMWSGGASEWRPQNFGVSHLRSSIGTSQFASATCSASQTLTWSSLTDTLTCVNIAIANTQVSGLGTASTKNFGTSAGNLVELDAGAKIPASLLPAGASSQWTTSGSNISYTAGSVGIGTSSPATTLHVAGTGIRSTGTVSEGPAGSDRAELGVLNGTPRLILDDSGFSQPWQIVNDVGELRFINLHGSGASMRVYGNGRDMFYVGSDGNVGIGTITPTSPMHVVGTSTITSGLAAAAAVNYAYSPASAPGANTALNGGAFSVMTGGTADQSNASVRGATGSTVHNTNQTLGQSIGVLSIASNMSTGTVTSQYGDYNSSVNKSSGTVSQGFGSFSEVVNEGTGTIGNAFAIYGLVRNPAGATITNSYELYLGTNNAGTITNQYGLYQANANARNVFAGSVGIGTSSPSVALEVNGAIVGKAPSATAGTTIDFGGGNLQYTSSSCGAMTLNNMKNGGTYTLAVQGTVATTACSFTAYTGNGTGSLTVRMPPDHTTPVDGKHTMYTFAVMGNFVYVSWVPGY